MKLFRRTYDWVLALADSPHAQRSLAGIAFVESFVFPIPPDVLLMPMCLGAPRRSLTFAGVTTAASVFGAAVGYAIGYWLWWTEGEFSSLALWFFSVVPGFTEQAFRNMQGWYERYDALIVFAAAFSPIPFKVITVTAGAFRINFVSFIVISILGRAARFFLVACLLRLFGERMKAFIEKYFNLLTILFIVLLVVGFVVFKVLLSHH